MENTNTNTLDDIILPYAEQEYCIGNSRAVAVDNVRALVMAEIADDDGETDLDIMTINEAISRIVGNVYENGDYLLGVPNFDDVPMPTDADLVSYERDDADDIYNLAYDSYEQSEWRPVEADDDI